MDVRNPLVGFAILCGFLLLGEAASRLLPVPIPGSVLGLLALWLALMRGWVRTERIRRASYTLLAVLPLLFVPGGAGITGVGTLREWLVVAPVAILTTLLCLVATGLLAQYLQRTKP
jgi:holin-like protein